MSPRARPTSLRSEITLWYSLVLLVALILFAIVSYLLLRQTLARAGTASLRQTAAAAEQLIVPPGIPRLEAREERIAPTRGDVEALRRRTRLATGEVVEIYVARSGDVEGRALRSFLLISLVLIPITAAAAAIGGRRVADRLLEPLDRLVRATREIQIEALSRRVEEPERPAEMRQLAQAFNGMLERLDRAVEALRRFTADASHELRTPLTGIIGTAQVALARERSPGELRETLAEVVEETQRMLHLVEGLLTLARGEEVRDAAPRETLDLVPLLQEVRELGEALAAGKLLELRLEAPDSLLVVGAPGPLRQVFLNLVGNAVKFTEAGSVVIRAREEATSSTHPRRWVEVSVTDTGPGIPAQELPRVFDRFYRGDAARGHEGGSGLGLAIARLIVEQHGGTIAAESEPGRGSTFRVRLPG
ncbi:MAG TPA: ATP-binding protein [Longimicrobiaceae bacterium]|nr:ATP-binding protein [Longimicrobiaceae bacterium]